MPPPSRAARVVSTGVLRDALMLELRGINRTAGAIAEAQKKPQMMEQFRMPWGGTDQTLPAKARAIADAAESMAADFVAHGHDETFVEDLRAHVDAFEAAGTTAGFGPLLDEAMTKVKQLDAFMNNFYRSNAEKMGEWNNAGHVERQAKAAKKPAPAKPNPTP